MQPLPSVFKQSLRSISLARTSCLRPTAFSTAFNPTRRSLRSRTICIQCQFKVQSRLYSSKGEEVLSGRRSLNPESSSGENHHVEQRTDQGEPKRAGLPSEAERRRSQLSKQFTGLMDHLQSNVFIAGQRLNDLTGYSAIEKLKREIEAQGKKPTLIQTIQLLGGFLLTRLPTLRSTTSIVPRFGP
jgi:sensitive to high expression protein 9, mitochondrial